MDLAKGQLVIACFLMFLLIFRHVLVSACLRFELIHFLRFPCQPGQFASNLQSLVRITDCALTVYCFWG